MLGSDALIFVTGVLTVTAVLITGYVVLQVRALRAGTLPTP